MGVGKFRFLWGSETLQNRVGFGFFFVLCFFWGVGLMVWFFSLSI